MLHCSSVIVIFLPQLPHLIFHIIDNRITIVLYHMVSPTTLQDKYIYFEISLNESWKEIKNDDTKYKAYHVIITASKTPTITLMDKKGKTAKLCFDMGATILLEGTDTIWYDIDNLIECS